MAKEQEKKDKSILGWFRGSNPNRKKVQKAVKTRQKKDKKDKNEGSYLSVKGMRKKYPNKTKGMSDEELKDISPKYRGTKSKFKKKFKSNNISKKYGM